jgi:hypothetical protein
MRRFLLTGFLIWLAGTVVLRFVHLSFLDPDRLVAVGVLYAVSFALVFLVIRARVVRPRAGGEAAIAVTGLLLPTLILDAFTSAYFSRVFPNLHPSAAGVFGGWMLICCAGGFAAAYQTR